MSMKSILILGTILFAQLTVAEARILQVPQAYATIQLGINAAVNGDTVVVAPGAYRENICFRGKNIVLTSRYYITGDSSFVASTVIDGSSPAFPDSGSVVRIVNHEDSTAVLQGFTLTGGSGTKWTDERGAGVYREGGGILVALSAPTIRDNVVINNAVAVGGGVVSAGGGGIRAGDGNPHIFHNVIASNTGRYGAGVVLNFTDAVFRNNIITRNAGGQDYGGGAVWLNHPGPSTKTLENNTIAGNTAAGGGIYVWFGSPTIVHNTIVWGNTSPQVAVRTGTALTVTYCDVQAGFAGTGNIDHDPRFSDASFHLSDTSVCVDGGDPDASFHDPQNPVQPGTGLWPSLGTVRNDIGAYGGPGRASFPPSLQVTSTGPTSGARPQDFQLKQNYPNPFNPSTRIDYQIPAAGKVGLKIFDVLGREVGDLVHEHQTGASYSVIWNASSRASGVYFYRLTVTTDEGKLFTETESLTLLK